jgi:thiol-disulfide isomerase/thioredoxin
MKRLILFGIVMIMIMAVMTGCTEEDNGEEGEEEELDPAPDFELTSIDGDTFKLSDFEGKVVVLDFMATWCVPCQEGMEHLKDIYQDYSESKVQIISIDIDESENDSMLQDFKDDYGDDWIFAVDYDNDADNAYDVGGVPTYVIVTKTGDIGYRNDDGTLTLEILKQEIDKRL